MLRVYITETEGFREKDRFLRACGLVDAVRLAKIHACRRQGDRLRSLCAGLLLQYALCREAGVVCGAGRDGSSLRGGTELRYGYGRHGKPCLLDYPQFHFSLSHSGNYAALAFSDTETGIDIQQRRAVADGAARKVLTEEEYGRYMRMETVREKEDWFFRLWCAKESYGKLTGKGLTEDFCRISLEEVARKLSHPVSGTALCREYRPADDYFMNVCVRAEEREAIRQFPENPLDVTRELLAVVT